MSDIALVLAFITVGLVLGVVIAFFKEALDI